jgi:hypothetical protein
MLLNRSGAFESLQMPLELTERSRPRLVPGAADPKDRSSAVGRAGSLRDQLFEYCEDGELTWAPSMLRESRGNSAAPRVLSNPRR